MNQIQTGQRRLAPNERRSELIHAAVLCLGRGGMSAFTIDQICRQAKVSRGLINHHFTSKNELLLAVYEHMTDYLISDQASETPEEHLRSFIDQSFDEETFDKSNLRAWLAIWGEVATNPGLSALHRERYGIYKAHLRESITKIAEQRGLNVDPSRVARNLIALIDGLWLEYCLHTDSFSLKMAREDCYSMLENYLALENPF